MPEREVLLAVLPDVPDEHGHSTGVLRISGCSAKSSVIVRKVWSVKPKFSHAAATSGFISPNENL